MIKFVFFDLGKVLVLFSEQRLAEQVSAVVGCSIEKATQVVFDAEHHRQYESGEISEDEYYELLCRDFGCRPDRIRLENAMCDIFVANDTILPILEAIGVRDIPRGILSNIGPAHWRYCRSQYPVHLAAFPDNRVTSFEVGAVKPDAKIFQAAHDHACLVVPDLQRQEVLFIDDLVSNVSAAKKFGWSAVQYIDTEQLWEELKKRGVL